MTNPSTSPDPLRPRVLFVGDDASSPQIAASLFRRVAGDGFAVATAGTQPSEPGGRSDEMLVAMGLNPANDQRLSARALHTADRVVILGDDLDVARLPGPRYEEWDLEQEDLVGRVESLRDDLTRVAKTASSPGLLGWLRTALRAMRRRSPGSAGVADAKRARAFR